MGAIGKAARAIRDAVGELTGEYQRMTVRQVFYALEVRGVVPKTEAGYRQVQNQMLVMRREGLLRWDFITDGTRWQRKPASWDDIGDYVESVSRSYRRDLWASEGVRIEVWLEKDALADLVIDVTVRWDVALMVSRGQSSATFLYNAARAAANAWMCQDVETFIFALHDHDAGGERAALAIERELPGYAHGAPIHFERLAVTEEQIDEWDLPTRPPKARDPQAAKWGDRPCVELDAIPPDQLLDLVDDAISSHVDRRSPKIHEAIEAEEREGLLAFARTFEAGEDQ